ncbi:MAG: hypothetical protein ACXWG1_16240, partial [Usitatibacter sp.]
VESAAATSAPASVNSFMGFLDVERKDSTRALHTNIGMPAALAMVFSCGTRVFLPRSPETATSDRPG